MFKSTFRLIKYSLLKENSLADGFNLNAVTSKSICTTSLFNKEIRQQSEKSRVGKQSKYGTLEGEFMPETIHVSQQNHLFPDKDTPDKLFNGIPFKELYIVNIKATPNNTIMNFTDDKGKTLLLHSSGIEGFKNAKKGTNIAAQQAAITFGSRIRESGVNTVRVRVQGIGAGRMSSIKGLQMTGLNIVSITDDTRVSWCPLRPRKQRRI